MSDQQPPQYPPQPQPTQPYGQQPAPGYGPPQQGYPPQPGYPPYHPQQPVQKSHTLRNVLLVVGLLLLLFVGGCIALVATAAHEVGKAIDEEVANDARPGGPDNPMTIEPGEAFEVSGFEYQAGWAVGQDFGLIDIRGLKVENNRDDRDSALVEIKFWSGSEVLAVSNCSSQPIAPGTTAGVDCFSGDALPQDYDKITINDLF